MSSVITTETRRKTLSKRGECEVSELDILAADLGMPNSNNFYAAIVTIASNIPPTPQALVTEDSTTIDLSGTGIAGDLLIASLTSDAIHSDDGSVVVTQEADGTFDLSVPAIPIAIITEDSTTVDLSGTGTAGDPLIASLTPEAIASADGSVIVTVEPDGTFDLSVPAAPITVSTDDTATIDLSGTGTVGDPLVADLAAGAITSADASVVVTQEADGHFDLSVPTPAFSVVTADTATIDLSGDGTVGTPLEADLAAGAITSADASVTVVQQPDGHFDLSVPASTVTTTDTATIDLSGDGTVGTPLEADLAAGAITSADASVVVTQEADGHFDLSVPTPVFSVVTADTATIDLSGDGTVGTPLEADLAAGAITSADASVTVVQQPDGHFDLSVTASTVTTTDTATIDLSGNGTVGTPLEADLAAGAITSADASVTVVQQPDGHFDLSVPSVALGSIPRTVVVGGVIGSTPNSPTLEGGIALLGVGTDTLPWQLLICPGTYSSGSPTAIPVNVNLVAFQDNTAIITQNLTLGDATATTISNLLQGLRFQGTITYTTSGKTGGTATLRARNSTFTSSITAVMRESVDANIYQDQVRLISCTTTGALSLTGGITNVEGGRYKGGAWTLVSPTNSRGVKFQARDASIAPATFSQQLRSFLSVYGCVLGGAWTVTGTNNTMDTVLFVQACLPNAYGPLPANPAGQVPWTLTTAGGNAVIKDTTLQVNVTKTNETTWSVTQPSLLGTGHIDRDLTFPMYDVEGSVVAPSIQLTLVASLFTPVVQISGGTPTPYTLPATSTMQITGPGIIFNSTPVSESVFTLTNRIAPADAGLGVTVSIQTPAVNEYPNVLSISWYD